MASPASSPEGAYIARQTWRGNLPILVILSAVDVFVLCQTVRHPGLGAGLARMSRLPRPPELPPPTEAEQESDEALFGPWLHRLAAEPSLVSQDIHPADDDVPVGVAWQPKL